MHYRKAAEQNTRDTHDQIKAKEEETITTDFKSGEYASLCRGDTSKVPVLSLLSICSSLIRIATANPATFYNNDRRMERPIKSSGYRYRDFRQFLSG